MIDLHLSAFAPRWRFLYAVRIDAYYAPMHCANYVIEITIAEQSFTEDNFDEALEFIYSVLATITPIF